MRREAIPARPTVRARRRTVDIDCSILEQVAPAGRIEVEREARQPPVNHGNPMWH
jgi:hypothetical protein